MSVEVRYLTLTEVAKRTGVRLSAVSNWRTRHSDFPRPQVVSGQEVFEVGEVAKWLRERKIPRNGSISVLLVWYTQCTNVFAPLALNSLNITLRPSRASASRCRRATSS